MLNYITLNSLILISFCARYSIQKPFGIDHILKKPPRTPEPFQFLGLYNEKDDQDGSKQNERHVSQSNKAFRNAGSFKNVPGKDQSEETVAKANHPKLGLDESRNQRVPGRKSLIRRAHLLRIQPSFLLDQIKQIFLAALQPFDTSGYKTTTTESIDKSINPNANQQTREDNKTLKELEFSRNDNNRTHQSKNQRLEKDRQFFSVNDTYPNSKFSTDKTVVSSDPFDTLQTLDTSVFKTTNIESIDKSINSNVNQPTHEDNKTLEELKLSRNHNNRTYQSETTEPEEDQQFFNFNDTFRNSEVSTDKTISSDPFDRIFFPPHNETHFTSEEILQAPNVFSNETDYNETLASPSTDLIIKPAFDLSEEFQQPERIESNSSSSVHLDKSFTDQTNQPTFESYKMYQELSKSANEKTTYDQFDQLSDSATDQPTTEFSKKAKKNESSISSSDKLDDFIFSINNQSIPEFEKILQDQEISEKKSENNIFKKSINSDISSQLLGSESSGLNSEFNTNDTTSNDQFVQILRENNQPYSNFSEMFPNLKVITNMTQRNDKPELLNVNQTNQPSTNFKETFEIFDFHTEIIPKNDHHDLIPIETNQTNVNTNRAYQNSKVSSSPGVSKDYNDQNIFNYTNQSTFHEESQETKFDTDETVRAYQFGQFNHSANKPNNDSSKFFRNSEDSKKTTVSYDNLQQFTAPQTYQFFFDSDKVFQELQASTILEADDHATATSFISNLIKTTFKSDGEFQTYDIALNKTDTNDNLQESTIPRTNQQRTEFLNTNEEPGESSIKAAKTFNEFIYEENYQTTAELGKNFQDKYFSKPIAFNNEMFENSVIPQTIRTEIEFTDAFQELEFHSKEFTTLTNSDLKTDQSAFAFNGMFRNPHSPEVTENDYIETNETSGTSQGLFEHDKLTVESLYSTVVAIGHETPATTLIPHSNRVTVELDTYKVFTDSVPIDFTINHPAKTSTTDFKEQKHLKNKTAINNRYSHQFLYPLCSNDSDLRKLAPCDNENMFFMCNDASSGTIKKCDRTQSQNEIPLCFSDLPHGRFLVSCSASPTKLCLYESEGETAVRFCREPEMAICIDERNKLQICQVTRFKRQVPKVPQLDKDGYYAKCEKCKLQVDMDVVGDKKPVVKIRSEPHDPDKDEEE